VRKPNPGERMGETGKTKNGISIIPNYTRKTITNCEEIIHDEEGGIIMRKRLYHRSRLK